jgi:hypothetical protein
MWGIASQSSEEHGNLKRVSQILEVVHKESKLGHGCLFWHFRSHIEILFLITKIPMQLSRVHAFQI